MVLQSVILMPSDSISYFAAILLKPNNSQTNVRNVVKICFQAICEVNFTILLKNLEAYIEKIKVRLILPPPV